MNPRLRLVWLILVLVSLLAAPAWADPFEEGRKAAARGDHEAAVWYYTEDINSGANTPDNLAVIHNNRGNSYNSLGRHEQAIADYNRALELRPGYAFAHNNRGSVYESRGDLQRALADYSAAIRLKSDYAKAFSNRAEVLLKLGRPQEALPDAERGASLDPSDKLTQRVLAQAREAVSRIEPPRPAPPPTPAGDVFEQGRQAAARGDYQAAIRLYTQDIESGNNSPEDLAIVLSNRGAIHDRLGQGRQALADFNRAMQLSPRNPEIYNNRGAHYENNGQLEMAYADYSQAILLKPDYAKAYSNRAEALLKLGRPREALPDAERGASLDPGSNLGQRVLQAVREALRR